MLLFVLNLTIKGNNIYNNKKYDDEGKVVRGSFKRESINKLRVLLDETNERTPF